MKECKQYDIDATFEKFDFSPAATAFLRKIVDVYSPDSFHWTYIEDAHRIAKEDPNLYN